MALTTHPHLEPMLNKEYSDISTLLWVFKVYSRVNFVFFLCSGDRAFL